MHKTTTRVAEHTSQEVNAHIRRTTEINVERYGVSKESITERLRILESEWDIERCLEVNGSSLLLAGLVLGIFVNRRWLTLPLMVGGFCLQHALQGWCPPIEVFRRMGIRTAKEIEEERTALKAIRGDFKDVRGNDSASLHTAMAAAHR